MRSTFPPPVTGNSQAADKKRSVPLPPPATPPQRFCNPHLCPRPQLHPPYPNPLLVPPPKLLHLNTFPYKATKQSRPIWSDSLKFIGAVKTLMWESFRSAIHKVTTQKEHFWKKK